MGLFGSWFDDLTGGGATTPNAPIATTPTQAPVPAPAPPDAIAQLQAMLQQRANPSPWQKVFGALGGGLKDFGMSVSGHPEDTNNISKYFGGIDQAKTQMLGQNALGQVMGDANTPGQNGQLPSDLPLKLAKLQALGVDITPIQTMLSLRSSMAPKYSKDDMGNIWQETPGQPPKLITLGPGKATTVDKSIVPVNPYAGGGDSTSQPPSALSEGDAQTFIRNTFPGSTITSGQRTPAHNAAVGGVPTSMHLDGEAVDFVPPQGFSVDSFRSRLAQAGLPATELLNEGDHIHWGWRPKGGASQSTVANKPLYSAPPDVTPIGQAPAALRSAYPGAVAVDRENKPIYPPGFSVEPDTTPIGQAPAALQRAYPGAVALDKNKKPIYAPVADTPLDPGQQTSIAKQIASYQIPPLSSFALKTPQGIAIQSEVTKINPSYQAQNYGKYAAGYKAFATGRQGDTVRSLNTWVQHAQVLSEAAQALGNHNAQAFNRLNNWWRTQTGSPLPTDFAGIANIYNDEGVKAILGSGGALGDREKFDQAMSSASSPAQIEGITRRYTQLAAGQLNSYRIQYKNATGRNDFDTLLAPQTIQALERHGSSSQGRAANVIRYDAQGNRIP